MALFIGSRTAHRAAVARPRLEILGTDIRVAALGDAATSPAEDPPADEGTPAGAAPEPTVTIEALIVALIVFGGGWLGGVLLLNSSQELTYAPPVAAGLGAFALFYVVAQASERLIELALPLLTWMNTFNKPAAKGQRDLAIAAAVTAPSPDTAKRAAVAQANVDQVTVNRSTAAFGLTAGVGMVLCGYLHANFLSAIGVSAPDKWWNDAITILVTGLAVGGGSKQLHDLIGNISKSSESKDKPTETGGS